MHPISTDLKLERSNVGCDTCPAGGALIFAIPENEFRTDGHAMTRPLNPPTTMPPGPWVASGGAIPTRWLDAGVALLGADGTVLQATEDFVSWLTMPANEVVGLSVWSLLGRRFPAWEPALRHLVDSVELFSRVELEAPRGLGDYTGWFRLELTKHAQVWVLRVGSVLPPATAIQDSSASLHTLREPEHREMLVRLMRAEAQLANLTNRWPGVIFSQRADFSFLFLSPNIEALTSTPVEAWHRNPLLFWQVIHEGDVEEVRRQIKSAQRTPSGITSTFRIRNLKTGRVSYILEHRQAFVSKGGMVLGYEGMWLDVTRQTIAEKRLSSAAWKETLAVVTIGLAHDFSNVMAGIHSISESFIDQLPPDHGFREGLGLIRQNSMQASQLVQRITQLHHGKSGSSNYYDLNQIVGELVELVRKIVPRRIQFDSQLSSDSLALFIDPVELRQVILNLVINAIDAMPSTGSLMIRTGRSSVRPSASCFSGTFPRLPAVWLTVEDTGSGIPKKVIANIFDPFFTTKSSNKGSGLGLYNSRLFVEKFHGGIEVQTQEGVGSRFTLWLPEADFTEGDRVVGDSAEASGARLSLLVAGAASHHLERTVEYLRSNAFHVVEARSPDTVVECLDSSDYRFAAMIVVVQREGTPYSVFLAEARKAHPDLKVVLQLVAYDRDELDTRFLAVSDGVIEMGVPEQEILESIRHVLKDTKVT